MNPLDTAALHTVAAAPEFPGPRPAVLVLPGGGYRFHAPHEGAGIAAWLSSVGCHAVVFDYPLPERDPWPVPLEAARAALDRVRGGDHGLDVDPAAVGVLGSSAGGHLAGLLATGAVLPSLEHPQPVPRPDFAVLCYPALDLRLLPPEPVATMLGGRSELAEELSPVTHLGPDCCPVFLWATVTDRPAVAAATGWAQAASREGARLELHLYAEGWHGLGLADGVSWGDPPPGEQMPPLRPFPHTATWTGACRRWLTDVVGGGSKT